MARDQDASDHFAPCDLLLVITCSCGEAPAGSCAWAPTARKSTDIKAMSGLFMEISSIEWSLGQSSFPCRKMRFAPRAFAGADFGRDEPALIPAWVDEPRALA
ncbi:hypothetical protein QTI68_28655 [Variovorax sp. J31P207]|nr:hypothetical protein [Variovorax sp. J31P207]